MSTPPESCANCRFYWHQDNIAAEERRGWCRVISPTQSKHPDFQVRDDYWCGDWQPQEPSDHVKIFADWLEQNGFTEAADTLRKFNR